MVRYNFTEAGYNRNALCDELCVAVWVVGHMGRRGRFQSTATPRLTADGSRLVRKHRLVKQSTLAVASSVPWHRYICTAVYLALSLSYGRYLMIIGTGTTILCNSEINVHTPEFTVLGNLLHLLSPPRLGYHYR